MLELLMDLILGSCWIWVKLVMDKALKEVCWLEELPGGWSNVMYGADVLSGSFRQRRNQRTR